MTHPLPLSCAGRTVGRYVHPDDLRADLSPRPYLHPVTTLAGTPVTEERPADHLHHLGVSMAVPDVEGHNFWGGRTYVAGRGPTALDNHGEQRHHAWKLRAPDGFVEDLVWTSGGTDLLRERRTAAAVPLTADAWALDLTSALTNPGGAALTIGSPATNGRAGAGYGGFFWRAPKGPAGTPPPEVFTADAEGEDAVHGRTADWLALRGADFTLVFAGATDDTRRDPWFVRTAEYPGVGSSLAWATRLPVPAGGTVVRRVVTVVADGRLDRPAAAALVRKALS
ncbi:MULTISPECIES: PmoA family protein [Streptomyces]|uniref:Oxidoreductase n=2 Tax=Streptomyces TaxID=1883 RepID=A0A100Y4J2_9ACTN|nr:MULTISPECIES: PmoA family protein [Streptomyces]KUH37526.1 oxidoreductase [Streptomyces kanasensis]UUS30462.1 PmoA family protein [Streptomyces changanensis]